ncbi:MAG: hypothetical protein HWD85_13445 [Flavobacteriaceae bacterium]|nr:hypothetical protein [Flavobacteriaceae bacterium]
MKVVDLIFIGFLGVFWLFFFWNWFKKGKGWEIGLLMAVFHFSMTYLSYRYILQSGGDSLTYWRVAAFPKVSQGDWVFVLPYSAEYFLWMIRPFARFLGLSFFSGTLLFSSLSLLAFSWILKFLIRNKSVFQSSNAFFSVLPFIVLFLPNTHFWTSLVGKESFLFFLTVLSMKLVLDRKFLFLPVILLLAILIRPVFGILILAVVGFLLVKKGGRNKAQKVGIALGSVILTIIAGNFLILYFDDFTFNFQLAETYAQYQYARFNSSGAITSVPMEDYNWIYRLFTVAFRPFIFESIEAGWMIFLKIENTILFLICLGIPISVYRYPRLFPFVVLILFYFFSIAISANVFGVFVRLKSVVTPFFALMGIWGWILLSSKIQEFSRSDS